LMPSKKHRFQLQLGLVPSPRAFTPVTLSFKLGGKPVAGVLHGDASSWTFESSSPVFLLCVPSGRLNKYALWNGSVPLQITELYQQIEIAAGKAGISLQENEANDGTGNH
ncbi:MAG TPA: hypothetical protein VEX63_02835, partial [Flavisolibacter sp.]|nr:hypothetical protein [Flavisolibacter sp.]